MRTMESEQRPEGCTEIQSTFENFKILVPTTEYKPTTESTMHHGVKTLLSARLSSCRGRRLPTPKKSVTC